jgi:hypothetical protein
MSNDSEEEQKPNLTLPPPASDSTPHIPSSAPHGVRRPYYNLDIAAFSQRFHNNAPTAPQPLPLNEAIRQLPSQYWRVLTHPKVATFAEEEGKAAWNIIWIQLVAIAVISAICAALSTLESTSILNALGVGNSAASATFNSLRQSPLSSGFASLIGIPLSFFISTGIYFLLARALRGQGNFLHYAYCTLLIVAPITLLNAVLELVPVLGPIATFALYIYEFVLLILMTMAVHRLSAGRASVAVLILPVVAIIVVSILAVLFLAVFSTTISH